MQEKCVEDQKSNTNLTACIIFKFYTEDSHSPYQETSKFPKYIYSPYGRKNQIDQESYSCIIDIAQFQSIDIVGVACRLIILPQIKSHIIMLQKHLAFVLSFVNKRKMKIARHPICIDKQKLEYFSKKGSQRCGENLHSGPLGCV